MPEQPTQQDCDALKKIFTAMIPLNQHDRLRVWAQVGVFFGFVFDDSKPKIPMRFGDRDGPES